MSTSDTGMKIAQAGNLVDVDPEIHALIKAEEKRQVEGLELIASENFTSKAVYDCLGSCLTNKYSEGQAGKRYYGGNEVIDQVELLCKKRALAAFHVDEKEWGVNVQPYSGSPANLAVYVGLLNPHDRVMGLDLPSGGHLTHGYYTAKKKISATSIFYESFPYVVDAKTGLIDYDLLEKNAGIYMPKMIICGGSAYPRDWDYKRFRAIADKVGAILMCDMAHISGLVATQEAADPFEYCDIVTSTTHKTLRGPRAGIIFYKLDDRKMKAAIDFAVFPSLQGGPHNHQIAAIATQLKQVATPEFKEYIIQVKKNVVALATAMTKLGHTFSTGGSDNHLLLWDLRPKGVTGSKVEKVCELVHISVNKNAIIGDKSAMTPGGVRLGTPALTSRGFKEADFEKVAVFLDRCVKIAERVQAEHGKALKVFNPAVEKDAEIAVLGEEVKAFASGFFMPGIMS